MEGDDGALDVNTLLCSHFAMLTCIIHDVCAGCYVAKYVSTDTSLYTDVWLKQLLTHKQIKTQGEAGRTKALECSELQ